MSSPWLADLERVRRALLALGCTVVATRTERVLVHQGLRLHAVPVTGDALRDCVALGRWLVEQRIGAGMLGAGEA